MTLFRFLFFIPLLSISAAFAEEPTCNVIRFRDSNHIEKAAVVLNGESVAVFPTYWLAHKYSSKLEKLNVCAVSANCTVHVLNGYARVLVDGVPHLVTQDLDEVLRKLEELNHSRICRKF